MQKLLVVFPDGVGIRNYLYSSALEQEGQELVLFHNFSDETISYLNRVTKFDDEFTIPDYTESVTEKFLRELICLSRLRHNAKITQNPTILYNWKTRHKQFTTAVFYKSVELAAKFVTTYESILYLEEKYQDSIRKNPFYAKVCATLRKIGPDKIVCTHQRGLKMPGIFAAARDLGIPTTTVIYSWDNLPKARLALRADKYHVWSDYMIDEMRMYYPEISGDRIVVSGTPQFDFYKNPDNIIPKDEFYRRYGLDSREIVCYSGDDITTSPDDHKYLRDLAQSIVDAGLENKFQVLFRRCPADFSDRYNKVISEFPRLIREAAPIWKENEKGGWSGIYPLIDDVELLVSTAYHCSLVINIGSTMVFDFAQFDKPCLYVNYDQPVQADPGWKVKKIYRFQHFKSMDGLAPVGWINNKDEIIPMVLKSIATPAEVGCDRHKWFNRIVGPRNERAKSTVISDKMVL